MPRHVRRRIGAGWKLGRGLLVISSARCRKSNPSPAHLPRGGVRGGQMAESTPQQGVGHGVPDAVGSTPARGAWHCPQVPSEWSELAVEVRCCLGWPLEMLNTRPECRISAQNGCCSAQMRVERRAKGAASSSTSTPVYSGRRGYRFHPSVLRLAHYTVRCVVWKWALSGFLVFWGKRLRLALDTCPRPAVTTRPLPEPRAAFAHVAPGFRRIVSRLGCSVIHPLAVC